MHNAEMGRTKRPQVSAPTLGDLILFCSRRTIPELPDMPAPWTCLEDELRHAGILPPADLLAASTASGGAGLLDCELPADLVVRVIRTVGVHYQAKEGYLLHGVNSPSLPLSAVEAFAISDLKTILRAAAPVYDGLIPIPGHGGRRIRRRLRISGKILLAAAAAPFLAAGLIVALPVAVPILIKRRAGRPGGNDRRSGSPARSRARIGRRPVSRPVSPPEDVGADRLRQSAAPRSC